jgi:hypothetical protein
VIRVKEKGSQGKIKAEGKEKKKKKKEWFD